MRPASVAHTGLPPLTNRLSVPVCYTKKISQKATFSKLFQREREGDLGKQLKQIQFLENQFSGLKKELKDVIEILQYIWLRPQRIALDNLANA